MSGGAWDRLTRTLGRVQEETGLPVSLTETQDGARRTFIDIRMAGHSLTPRTPKPLFSHPLTGRLTPRQALLFLRAFLLGWRYGAGTLRPGKKPEKED